MSYETRFAVGDTVRVTGRFGNDKGTATVVKVLKTRLVTSDGFRYTLDGHRLQSGGTSILGSSIRKETN